MLNTTVLSMEEADAISKKLWPELQEEQKCDAEAEKDGGTEKENINSKRVVQITNDYLSKMEKIPAQIFRLEQELKVEQGKEADLLHFIELNEFSDSSKVNVFGMLQECLQHRREIKDEMLRLQSVSKMIKGLVSSINYIEHLAERKYFPRQLNELFV